MSPISKRSTPRQQPAATCTSLTVRPRSITASLALYLPTAALDAATLSFSYRFTLTSQNAQLAWLRVRIVSDSVVDALPNQFVPDAIVTPLLIESDGFPGADWQQGQYVFNTADLNAMIAASAQGSRLFVLFELYADQLTVDLDNIQLQVAGSTELPQQGRIAFTRADQNGYPIGIDSILPNGSDRRQIWQHPGSIP